MHSKTNIRRAGVLLAVIAAFLLTACSAGTPVEGQPAKSPVHSLEGDWKGGEGGVVITAHIAKDEIKMNLVMRDMSGLYWAGTFPTTQAEDNIEIKSTADRTVLEGSLFGSQDGSKTFNYHHVDEEILFDFTIMGTTQTITLSKTK